MHDTLSYLRREPVHRSFHLDELTFRSMYHATEHYMLPLSHDEVVHGKGSLLNQMAGDPWQRFANLRLLFGLQYAQPGKKLLFMGGEFAQEIEWAHDHSLDWHVLDRPSHAGILALITELNALYRRHGALHRDDLDGEGFSIIDADASQSVLCIERYDRSGDRVVACFNGTPVPRPGYRVGMPSAGPWSVILNSDDSRFGGSSSQIEHEVTAVPAALHGREWSAALDLPPLGFVLLSPSR
jgi:1,4-alpha-glucan branching enzyme